MDAKAKLTELIDHLEGIESDDFTFYFDRQTGEVVMLDKSLLDTLEAGDEGELKELEQYAEKADLEIAREILEGESDRFIRPPDPFDFHEYRHMERFIGTLNDGEAAAQLWQAIKGQGAFRYFKDTLIRLGIQQQWFDYREDAMKEFCLGWAEANNIPYEDDVEARRKLRSEARKQKG